jgi:uncharacterized protein
VQLTYPGVYVTEIPSSVRPIATVSTSIGAFIDRFAKGPVNEAVQIFGMADFERVFGGINADSEASYQIAQFFLNGGPSAWVIRVAKDAQTAAAVAKIGVAGGATEAIRVEALSAGAWGNVLRFVVEPAVEGATVSTKLFNLFVAEYAASDDKRAPLVTERYLNVSTDAASPRWFVDVVNNASQLVRVSQVTANAMPLASGTVGGTINTSNPFDPLDGKTFQAEISWIPGGPKTCTLKGLSGAGTDLRKLRASVEAAIRESDTDPAYASATVMLVGDRFVVRAGRSSTYDPWGTITITNAGPPNVATALGLAAGATVNVHEYRLGQTSDKLAQAALSIGEGKDGSAPDANVLIGSASAKTGMYALEDVDVFNLMSVPLVAKFSSPTFALSQLIQYCEQRRAFFLVDIPEAIDTPQEAQDWVDNNPIVRSKNAAVYFPRVQIPDPKAEFRLRSVGTSGTVAGVYARTDTERGVWKAPAGVDAVLRGIGGLDYKLSDPENGVLNGLGIDCLRTFPIYGHVAWGARTGVGADAMASEWKYVPIRRLALMIEESLFRGTKWVVFEPNDEPLWAKIRQNVGTFMMNLFRQGAFQGSTPDKAFFVKCDGETTTAADRNLGIVNIEVGFAPLKPAEFVVLKIQQIPDVK